MSPEQRDAFTAGYNARFDKRPNEAGDLPPALRRYFHSGYVQASNDLVIFKRTDRAANLRAALGEQ